MKCIISKTYSDIFGPFKNAKPVVFVAATRPHRRRRQQLTRVPAATSPPPCPPTTRPSHRTTQNRFLITTPTTALPSPATPRTCPIPFLRTPSSRSARSTIHRSSKHSGINNAKLFCTNLLYLKLRLSIFLRLHLRYLNKFYRV